MSDGRIVGQTRDTGFQIGVRRTLAVSLDDAWRRLTSPEGVRAWLGEGDLSWDKRAPYRLADGSGGEVRVFEAGHHLRLTWQPPDWPRASTIQLRVIPAAGGKTTVAFHQEHLPGPDEREARRQHFAAALDALARP